MSLADTVSVNAVATLLAYAPFKLSVVFRATYHRVIDGMAVLTFGGWTFAMGSILMAGLVPAILLRRTPLANDPVTWLGGAVVGAVIAGLLGALVCRSLATGAGWRFVRRTAFRVRGREGLRVVRGPMFTNLHTATHMLASPKYVVSGALVRLADGLSNGLRFVIAAAVLGVDVDTGTAMVVGVAFFVIGALAPTGTAGVREGGALGVFAFLGVEEGVAPVVVFVAATGILGELAMGAAALAWLGPRRLRSLFRGSKTPEATGPPPDPV